jgi:hypothetical protein
MPESVESRKLRPVLWWALIGALFFGLMIYVFSSWILSGEATNTPTGPTDVPGFMVTSLRIHEVGLTIAFVYLFYRIVIKPWRREGHITWDGTFFLACWLICWQDPLTNYFQHHIAYNSEALNWGSWLERIPGSLVPNGSLFPEGVLFATNWYAVGVFGGIVVANALMRRIKERWPRLGPMGLLGALFITMVVVDVLLEIPYTRLGIYSFAGAIEGWTLFHGHYYQFPIYEALLWPFCWTVMTAIRYFRNDRGQSILERGIDEVRIGPGKKVVVRFLALFAGMNLCFLLLYNLPIMLISLHSSAWPQDVVERSYFTNGLCGPGSEYACSGPAVPIPTRRSAHLGPDNQIVVPLSTKLPTPVLQSAE